MLPMIVSRIFVAGLVFAKTLRESSESWNNREEHEDFYKNRKQWLHEGWMLYR